MDTSQITLAWNGIVILCLVKSMSNMLFGNDTNNDRKDYIFDVLSNGLVDLEVEKSVIS